MNYLSNEYDPLRAMQGGMDLYRGMEGSYDRQRGRMQLEDERDEWQTQRDLAKKKRNALAQMGQQPNFVGMEDDALAVRPQWLTDVYAAGDPDFAMKAESMAATPRALERAATQAGKLEREKLGAKVEAWKGMMPGVLAKGGQQQAASQNALARPVSLGVGTDQGVLPTGGGVVENPRGVGDLGRAMEGDGLEGLSGDVTKYEFDLEHGPKMKYEPMSPLDVELKKRESILKGKTVDLDRERLGESKEENSRSDLRNAHTRVRELTKEKTELEKDRATGNISPQDYKVQKQALDEELASAKAHRESLLKAKGPASDGTPKDQLSSSDKEKLAQAQATQAKPRAPKPAQQPTAPEIGAGLPYKMQQEMKAKTMQRGLEKSQDTILDAHATAEKHVKHYQTGKDLMNLLATEDVGSPWAKVPGGNMAATIMSDKADRLDKWRSEMIDTIKQEGQSQLMNTLPELAIVSSELPSIENRPDLNREAISKVMSKYEAYMAAPKFLEEWAHNHGGSLDGARQVFRDWMKHSPKYTIEKQGGKSQVYENDIIPLDAWSKLSREMPAQEIMRRLQSGKLQVINGRVYAQ